MAPDAANPRPQTRPPAQAEVGPPPGPGRGERPAVPPERIDQAAVDALLESLGWGPLQKRYAVRGKK